MHEFVVTNSDACNIFSSLTVSINVPLSLCSDVTDGCCRLLSFFFLLAWLSEQQTQLQGKGFTKKKKKKTLATPFGNNQTCDGNSISFLLKQPCLFSSSLHQSIIFCIYFFCRHSRGNRCTPWTLNDPLMLCLNLTSCSSTFPPSVHVPHL